MARDDTGTRLCRDCGIRGDAQSRCNACGSPRLLNHPELHTLTIAHLDCDAFYAAVEKRDDPTLLDKPLIVGGNGPRGVVSTCCYIARTYGIHSAQPMFKAKKLCPDAVILRPDMKKYSAVSREIRALMREVTPDVEPISVDEAFLGLAGTERLHRRSPAESMAALARQIEDEIGITVSVGLSYNKFLAKIASDLDKPRGFSAIGRKEAKTFLAKQPVSIIWGVGKALETKLRKDGIVKVRQLQEMEENVLMKRYGVMGRRLYHFSRGNDTRSVNTHSPTKSISSETTFDRDRTEFSDLESVSWRQAEKVSDSLKKKNYAGRTVTLKLKTGRHRILTRSRSLDYSTQLADVIFEAARDLLAPMCDGTPYRLLGVGVSGLCDPADADQPDLIEPERTRRAKAERTMDTLRQRFGDDAVRKGRSLR